MSDARGKPTPMTVGVALAVVSAIAFGVTTPLIERVGRGVGPLTTAGLLYAGASLFTLLLRPFAPRSGRALTRRALPRLLAIAAFGAALAPIAMVVGLGRVGAFTGSLLLNLEAVFTVLLGFVVYREPMGSRVLLAAACMTGGGVILAFDAGGAGGTTSLIGILALVGCTFFWAADNTLSRALRDEDPSDVVLWKGALGAIPTLGIAIARGESLPSVPAALGLLACGATGYGASLRLYLLAQRRIGASRTGSAFATGPFIGALLAWAIGERQPGALALGASAAFGLGVYLHLGEGHAHPHLHEPVEHEHAHRHDDGHHDHAHDPPVVGEHTHPHRHDRLEHEHEHGVDIHHDHHRA